jgi:flagellar biosynthesis protein FlhB
MAGGEKTEQPTPKKLRDAKKKGQVMHSKDLSSAVVFIVAIMVLIKTGSAMSEKMQDFMSMCVQSAVSQPWNGALVERLRVEGFQTFASVLAPLLGGTFIAALMISGIQSGGVFSMEVLMPKFDKLNPLEGFKRMFALKGIVQLVKSTVILILVFFLAYQVVKGVLRPMLLAQRISVTGSYTFAKEVISTLLMRVGMVMAVIGGADFMYQRWQFNQDMMMTKEEVKNEYKEQEGDPHYKAKRKRMHQEISQGNMMRNARKADVVVVNPTRYAIAIQYDKKNRGAPVVVAKGERIVAEKIRQIAKEEGIPIMRNVALAQALMKVEVDEVIPEDLYEAVAEVLNWVYKMKRETR